jgi:hypothetical protein
MMCITRGGYKLNTDIFGKLTHHFGNRSLLIITVTAQIINHKKVVTVLIGYFYFYFRTLPKNAACRKKKR